MKCVWASLCPRTKRVCFYPKKEAQMIESAYSASKEDVYLGLDFYVATVHLPCDEKPFQTTPTNHHLGQYKQPGYRSVRRWEGTSTAAFARRVHGEWRFCDDEEKSECALDVQFPPDVMIDALMPPKAY